MSWGEWTMEKIGFIPVIAIFCLFLVSCSKISTESMHETSEINSDDISGDITMFHFLNLKCHKAIQDAQDFTHWKKDDNKGAKIACAMFDKYLSNHKLHYDKLEFITEPAGSYYFIKAYIEREIVIKRSIHIKHGVIEQNTEGAMEAFAKDIKVLETTENALRLAKLFHCFHAGGPMCLVTHSKNNSWHPEQVEPAFIKNEDGSMTLIYDLVHTGRSVTVKQCVINISTNYKVTLECKEKLSKND